MNQKAESTTVRIKTNPERWQRLKNILADALEQTSFEERTARLRQSCADDTELFREVEKLLAHDTTAFEEFAEFAATRLRQDERDRIGQRIGAYAVIRQLGRGGMGAVYLAERADGQFEKQVAIKVLKRGTDTDEVLHRFRVERQILANLDHPNITRLLDAGTTNDGLPYFVMDFIEGTAITHFVQQENVNLRSRLKLFLKVCSAVALAHRNQIIHRDIKPTNVLVKRDGEPKLLDFGIAKLLNMSTKDGDITVAAERRLTPVYASPEQNAGQSATIASDVYSLGALLYELLTAQPPRRNSKSNPWPDVESEHLIAPPLPSQVVTDPKTKQQLQGQLDQIVATAMRRDPAQRYSSVTDLSDDIERYLNGAAPRSGLFSTAITAGKRGSRNLNLAAGSRRRWYITAAAFAMIAIAAVVVLPRLSVSRLEKHRIANATATTSPVNVTDTIRSIAVLPFEPLGRDMDDELLGLGMADAVIGRMSYLKQLVVLPTSAVSKYKGSANDPLAAGRALGVDAILSGTVQRSGKQVRATVQLVNVSNGNTVWSEKFDLTFTDIFRIQDSISDSVARSLALNLTADEQKQLRKHYTTNPAAYDSYLMGLYFWGQRSKDGLEKAINYFQQAVEKDSNFALAYALMADCYYLQVYYRYNPAPETIGNANAAAERALLLDDSIAEGYVARAMVQSLQKKGRLTEESLHRALELNPNLAIAHLRYAWCLAAFGQLNGSVREMKRAQELDPLSPTNNAALGMILVYARQFPASLDYCYKAAELAPNEALVQENLAVAYALNGMYQQAIEHYQRVGELNPEKKGDVLAWVATVLVSAGRKLEADSMMPEILDLATVGKADPYNIAVLCAARGEKKSAFEWFAKALETTQMIDPLIRYDPQLDALRSDSRFAVLLRQHNRALLLETP
jgi:serine/threonine protein kinase/TolB-like protein/Tfp pilus assembly protein PilF